MTAVLIHVTLEYLVDGPPEHAEARALAAYINGVEPHLELDATPELEEVER